MTSFAKFESLVLVLACFQHAFQATEAYGTLCPSGATDPSENQAFFYFDKNFEGDCYVIDLATDGEQKTMENFEYQNKFSSVKWNLQTGYGMTVLRDNCDDCEGDDFWKIYEVGGTELMGTGQVESISDLDDMQLDNTLNQWGWFQYNEKRGYVDVYHDEIIVEGTEHL